MRTVPAFVFAVFGVILVASGAWLLITGRNFPGVFGRGLSEGDRLRTQRAPVEYWRVAGAIALLTGVLGFGVAGITLGHPTPTRGSIIVLSLVVAGFLFAFTPLVAWVLVIASRHRLFRWDKP